MTKSDIRILDLINIIHFTIIDKLGVNEIILQEIQNIEYKIKQSKELENYLIDDNQLWKELLNNIFEEIKNDKK